MTLRDWVPIVALLVPGLGLILVLIGSVVYIAVAQSFGYYACWGKANLVWNFGLMFLLENYFLVQCGIRFMLVFGVRFYRLRLLTH